ncbi:MAG: hypothetical protein Q9157_000669 [Trypethelium eluteriae]
MLVKCINKLDAKKAGGSAVMKIDGVDPEALERILYYLYTGTFVRESENRGPKAREGVQLYGILQKEDSMGELIPGVLSHIEDHLKSGVEKVYDGMADIRACVEKVWSDIPLADENDLKLRNMILRHVEGMRNWDGCEIGDRVKLIDEIVERNPAFAVDFAKYLANGTEVKLDHP